ncbi:MAG: EexN family lipoprotein [Azoarcus sp.]|jgi:predicted Fe-S protein YdhL (DUF1289 family)|nr:EexN family lipoprotein [Azoarcus sp.]
MTKQVSTPALAALFALGLALAACEREVQTVEWYKAHDVERMEVIIECKENPDKLARTENCINAKKAQREILNSGQRRAPANAETPPAADGQGTGG